MYTRHCTQMCTNSKRLRGKWKLLDCTKCIVLYILNRKDDKNVKKYNFGHEILSNYDHYVTILFVNIMTHSSIQVSKQAQFYFVDFVRGVPQW